jgi:hypothetical protein
MHREKKLPSAGNPPGIICGGHQSTGGDEAMEMNVQAQLLIPGVQQKHKPYLPTEGVAPKREKRLGGCVEQEL